MTGTLYAILDPIDNPMHDRRATAGLRTLKAFPAHSRFVLKTHFKTGEVLGIAFLWDTTVHTISLREDDPKCQRAYDALMAEAFETDPHSYDTCMMTIDPLWSGMGCSPSPAEMVLDKMIYKQDLPIEKALRMLTAADAEGRK